MINLSEYYEGFFNNSIDAILVINDNKLVHFNNAALEMFGYTKEEFKEIGISGLSPEHQVGGEDSFKKFEWMLLLSIKNGSNRFEWVHLKKDGRKFHSEVLLTPVIEKTINVYMVVRDITDKKKREYKIKKLNEEVDFILQNIDIFLYRYNRQGIIQYISPSIKKITGYEEYEWRSSYLSYLTNSPINIGIDQNISIVLEDKRAINYDVEIYKKNGDRLVLNLDEKPYFDENNELGGVIGIAQDISKELKIEESVYYAQKMEILSNLASGFTHDVNNSLTVLKGNVEIIKNKLIEFDLLGDLDKRFVFVEKSMTRIVEMLEKILILSKRNDSKKQDLDLNSFILGISEDLKKVFTKNVNIEVQLPGEEAIANISLYNLTQIFLSILVNSYNLMTIVRNDKDKLGGNIKIILKKTLVDDKEYWKIEVSDDCVKVVEEIINLSSIIKLVKKENGIFKMPIKGRNIFEIFLPPYSKNDKNKKEEFDLLNYNANGETVLIIDDEILVVKTASEILKNFGFNVIFALNGEDGLKLYKQNINEVSLTIIDMDMPKMDGREVFYELKKLKEDMKIVVSSGYRDDTRVLELISIDKVGFIPKPYSMKLFIEEIINALKK